MTSDTRRKGTHKALRWLSSLVAAVCLCAAAPLAVAQDTGELHATVSQGIIEPLPIAVTISSAPSVSNQDLGNKIAAVVMSDLESSGYFRPIPPAAYVQTNMDVNVQPNFADWRSINAQALTVGRASLDADGRLQVDFRLWDTPSGRQFLGKSFAATPENWRRVAHMIADAIYETLTGEKGYFDSRIVFVAESGPRNGRVKRLAIMDQDGANPSYITDGTTKVMTPRFSADSQEIAYMSLSADTARIYIMNIDTGRQEAVGTIRGMAFAPRFSPDGTKLAFSVDQGGNSDIYVMDLHSRSMTRITRDPAIDTSPSFSPDGTRIAFTSDRGGSPQIYMMNLDGSNVQRVTFGGGAYSTPVFSPKGDKIAFTKQSSGRFSIGVMNPDGSGEQLLTSSFLEEGPTWSPNGRYIMFFREPPGSLPSLWMVEVNGRVERRVPYQGGASDPAWSPSLN